MNKVLKTVIIILLAVSVLSFCATAAVRIIDKAGIIAFNMEELSGSLKGSSTIVTHNLGELRFRGIEAATAAKVTVRSADDPNRDVILRVNENLAERVELKVRDGILKISFRNATYSFKSLSKVTFEVSVPHCEGLSSLEAVAAAEIEVTSPLTAPKIEVEASGAAKISAPVDCTECEAEAAGASKIILTGRCTKLEVEAAGASKIDASECESVNCAAEAVGASKVSVWCTGSLSADAVGASKVTYKGDCAIKLSSVGASSVRKID